LAGEFYVSNLVGDFDYQAYLDKLREVKLIPVNQLKVQEQQISAKVKALSSIASVFSSVGKAASALSDEKIYETLKATVSNPEIASASVTGNPVEGSYSLEVSQLARANTYKVGTISSVSDPDEIISVSGSLEIKYLRNGKSKVISINYENKSLREIVEEINNSEDLRATLVNTGTVDSPDYQLVVTSAETGTGNKITGIDDTSNPGDDSSGFFSEDSSKTYESQSAQDAKIKINGVEFKSYTNDFDNKIDGLKITVKKTGTVNLKVENDYGQIKSKLKKLLEAYNKLHDTLGSLTSKGQPLQGEYSLHSLERTLFNLITNKLGKYGILDTEGSPETTKGHLILNENQLEEVISNPDFQKELKSVSEVIKDYVDSFEISLDNMRSRYQSRIRDIEERVDFMQDLIDKEIESMRLRFAKLETYLSEMKAIQMRIKGFASYLSQNQDKK